MAGAVAVILAAACSSPAADVESTTDSDGSVAIESASPLLALIGFSSDTELNRERFSAIQSDSDTQVAACMMAQGFTWQPTAPLPGSALAAGDRTSLAWARAHGLGVTDQLTSLSEPSAVDPNTAYLASLDADEADRWKTTLWGDTSSLVSEADEPVVYAPAGCLGAAYATSRAAFALFQQFDDELQTLDNRIAADPRVMAHQTQWVTCMQAAGYSYVDQASMRSDLFAQLLAIPGVEQVMTAASSDNGALLENVDQAALAALVERERATAVANVECAAPTRREASEIRGTYERQFIIDHRQRLEAAVAQSSQSARD